MPNGRLLLVFPVVPTLCLVQVAILKSHSHPEITTSLSERLRLPTIASLQGDRGVEYSHVLSVEDYQYKDVNDFAVCIRKADPIKKRKKFTMTPFFVDFLPPITSRLGQRFSQSDLLVKAVSPRGCTVFDATAGLGQDSLLLARAGAASVHMVERDPIVCCCLLQDGLRRLNLLADKSTTAKKLSQSLTVELGDSYDTLFAFSKAGRGHDIVYLDPMFPTRKKTASVKKNMQILQSLLESQQVDEKERLEQEGSLLMAAMEHARQRVVVKRPSNASHMGTQSSPRPSYSVSGPTNRWDVYVTT